MGLGHMTDARNAARR